MSDDVTRTSANTNTDETRMSPASGGSVSTSGWLSSSGSVDHGRFAPGTLLDNRYRVLGLLGRGGMGEVYRADDLRLGQQVALKFLPEALAVDARRLAQFHNEVRTARQVSHPNVCRVYDIGEINGQLFLTMEYVDGEDLSLLLRRIGRLPEERAVEIARQISAGLAAAHERGILHRDLKPANIMLDGAGKVRIMDFSLAAVGQVEDVRAGTPAYMAPEQLAGLEVTVRSDIYALGLVLYEVFTGRRTFDAKTIADLVEQHQSGTITAPGQLVTSLDPVVDRAIMRCLEADPQRRPASALAVAASLPGGDPIAAAIAAGETPTPEMIAAVGGQTAAMSASAGWLWLAAIAVLVVLCLRVSDQASLFARVPLSKGGEVLADRADQIRQTLGFTDAATDHRFGFAPANDYLQWSEKSLTAQQRAQYLAAGRPTAMQFWYRSSPVVLVPKNPLGAVTTSDPQLAVKGMVTVVTDLSGRLLRFEAAPPQQELPASGESSVTSWDALFSAAGIDRSAFTDAAPSRTPATFADERRAWQGTYTGTSISVRIEAAAYRGRPVQFEIVGPWTTAPRDAGTLPGPGGNPYLITALLVGAVLAARANIRSGRADRRGAFRLAAFMFAVIMATWVFDIHVADAAFDQQRFFAAAGIALFLGGAMYLIYLGLEPFVRRSSPMVLVGWSRVLTGRIRDPLVGHDVLLGVVCGAASALLNLLPYVAHRWLPVNELAPFDTNVGVLEGMRPFLRDIVQAFNGALQSALITVFEWVTYRMVAEWAWMRGVRRLVPTAPPVSERGLAISAVLIITLFSSAGGGGSIAQHALNGALALLSYGLLAIVILRVGLLGTSIGFLVANYFSNMSMTMDFSKLYASGSLAVLAFTGALALAGFWLARSPDHGATRVNRMR